MKKISDRIRIGKIIGKYITGNESVSDSDKLNSWLNEDPENQLKLDHITEEREIVKNIEAYEDIDTNKAWNRYEEKIAGLSLRKQILKWKIAAILVFLVGIAGSLVGYWSSGNGKSALTKSVYTTVVTENGQTSRIILPDSTVVWLNSGTALSYNNNFSVNNRDVKLKGEAYFKVARNENIPLIVHCEEMEVKVLGTEFDVNAFSYDDKFSVVLEKGSIELSHINNKFESFTMTPGEIAKFDDLNNKLVISRADTYEYVSWKDGVLIFNNTSMKQVISRLEHWYGVDIEVNNPKVYDLIFNATIVDENLEDIFHLIKYTCDIDYKITYSHDPLVPIKIEISMKN
jgi:ferric-dicitrate binding protein FerR (iron transport regulator)